MTSTVKIFEVTLPHKEELCCVICKVSSKNDSLLYSNFCSNKLKCRQFLHNTSQAMAAPITNRKILEAGGSLYIIVTKEFFENSAFQDHCDALNIQIMDLLDPIPTHVYKTCLLHTMEYRLAPQWNKVGSYLIEGRDFLKSTGYVNAITLNIKEIHSNNARFQVEAANLKIPFLKLSEKRPLQHDLQPPVRVLPSMKMANVLRISKQIKETDLFINYEHLRTYWNDMHGYVLPEYDEKLLYYEVEFFCFKPSVFLYPETCLASGPLQILRVPMDPIPIIYRFVTELRDRLPELCGRQLNICPENIFTSPAPVLPYTPILPKAGRYLDHISCDTGYSTGSKRSSSVTLPSRMREVYETSTKRPRLSLPRNNDLTTNETEFDEFDFGISSNYSSSKFQSLKNTDDMSKTLYAASDISKSIVKEDEKKSHYFEQKGQRLHNETFMEQQGKDRKSDKLSLKEKLLKNTDTGFIF